MSLANTYAITIAFNDREAETVHMITEDGRPPTEAQIRELVSPMVRQTYHESGSFEIEDIQNVQESINTLLSYSQNERNP